MSKKEFDPTKVLYVDIEKVIPNTWNPKEENTPEYFKIKQSIETNGMRGAIAVREHPTTKDYYEIIDGKQRHTAAKELGYKQIPVYNEGQVDEEAKELTIWWQQQVPFSRILEAYLVTSMADEFGQENLNLPYSEAQYKEFDDLANFNFDEYKDEEFKEDENGLVTFSVKLTKQDFEIVHGALNQIISESDTKIDLAEALVQAMAVVKVDQEGEE